MKLLIGTFCLLLVNNCSFNKNSNYWNEDNNNKKFTKKKLNEIIEKSTDVRILSFNEYHIYIEDHIKKSKYPDINE